MFRLIFVRDLKAGHSNGKNTCFCASDIWEQGNLEHRTDYEADGFAKALCQTFADYGIETELEDCGLMRSDIMKMSDLEHK